MADTGFVICGTGQEIDYSGGTISWDVLNLPVAWVIDDATDCGVILEANEISEYGSGVNYGFSVPSGATIDGIEVRFGARQRVSTLVLFDESIRLVDEAGAVTGDDKSAGAGWPDASEIIDFGGTSDLWGGSWTVAKVNDADFGFAFAVETNGTDQGFVHLDHLKMRITYTEGTIAKVSDFRYPMRVFG